MSPSKSTQKETKIDDRQINVKFISVWEEWDRIVIKKSGGQILQDLAKRKTKILVYVNKRMRKPRKYD